MDRSKGLASLKKSIKDGALSFLSDQKEIKAMSTGIATLDSALGAGGFVRGGQHILYGPPSGGKSALCYTAIGNLMRHDPEAMACIFDIERSANMDWLVKFGIDPQRTVIVKEPTIEDSVNTFQQIMRANVFDYIVIDSLGAVIRAVTFDGKDGQGGDASKAQVAGSSSVITQWVNKANAELINLDKRENAGEEVLKPAIIYINQVRDNFGSMYGGYVMPGGHALQHMANVIVRITASGAAGDKIYGTVRGQKEQVGTRVSCVIEKNKYAPKNRAAGYDFCFEECPEHDFGIDSYGAALDLAIKYGVIRSAGAWCFYGVDGQPGFVKTQGRAQMLTLLKDNPEFYDVVYAQVISAVERENEKAMMDA